MKATSAKQAGELTKRANREKREVSTAQLRREIEAGIKYFWARRGRHVN